MSSTLVEINIPDAATEVIEAAGLSVGEFMQRLLQQIAHNHAVPDDLLNPQRAYLNGHPLADHDEEQQTARNKAIDAILALRKSRQSPAASIDEIIAWRDEGRR